MPLIVENNIRKMTTTTTLTGPHPFNEIFHNQIAKWLPYVLYSLTNSIFEVLNRRWAIGVDLLFHVAPKEEVAMCSITRSRWQIVILITSSRDKTVRKLFPRKINGFVACVAVILLTELYKP